MSLELSDSPLSVQLSGNLIEVIANPGKLQDGALTLYSVLVRWRLSGESRLDQESRQRQVGLLCERC
jgi:hypothetical protein